MRTHSRSAHLCTLLALTIFTSCAPDLVIEDTPRPPLAVDVIDPRTGDSLRVEVLLQQSMRATGACVEVLDVSSGDTTTGRRCESVGRAVQRGPVSVGIDVPALPFGAVVTLGVVSRDFAASRDSTALIVTGVPDSDPPPLASFVATPTGGGDVDLAWTLAPEPFGTKTVRILRRTGEPPSSFDDPSAVVVYDGDASVLTHTDASALFADPVGYAAWAFDTKAVASSPVFAEAAP
jgi:hypothetical protein